MNATNELALAVAETAGPIRLFRIGYTWKRGSKFFAAHTVWGFRGNGKDALNNFLHRNPHVISARVEREAT